MNTMNTFKSGAQAGLTGNLSNRGTRVMMGFQNLKNHIDPILRIYHTPLTRIIYIILYDTVARGKKALRKALAAVKTSSPHVTTTRVSPPQKRKEYKTPDTRNVAFERKKRRVSQDVVEKTAREREVGVEKTAKAEEQDAHVSLLLSLDRNVEHSLKHEKKAREVPAYRGTRLTPLFSHCTAPSPRGAPLSGEKKRMPKAPVGFSNLGNTCYLNSTIQCMLNVPEFVREVQRIGQEAEETSVTHALCKVVHMCEEGASGPRSLGGVKSALERHFPSVFAGRNQQDAHECFVRILEAIETENPKSYVCPFSFTVSVDMRCQHCKHQTLREEKGNVDIGLDLPQSSSAVHCSIENLLTSRYFKPERIHKNCDGCGEKDAVHGLRRRLSTYPKALVIHLKRFVFNAQTSSRWVCLKNASMVHVPVNLSASSLKQSSSMVMDMMTLCGIVHHHGSRVESGHYVADVYREPSSWYRCNDSIVTKGLPAVDSTTCYMAMYHTTTQR